MNGKLSEPDHLLNPWFSILQQIPHRYLQWIESGCQRHRWSYQKPHRKHCCETDLILSPVRDRIKSSIHLSGLALKILYKRFKHPKNVETSVHDSAACTPTRFRVCEPHGEYAASGFIVLISAWTPLTFPDMAEPLSKPWPLQSAMSMWCSSNVFSIISDISWPVLPLNSSNCKKRSVTSHWSFYFWATYLNRITFCSLWETSGVASHINK